MLLAGSGLPARGEPLSLALPVTLADGLLKGAGDALEREVTLDPAATLRSARLELAFSNALAVLPDGSRLRVALNGQPMAEVPLAAAERPARLAVSLPAAAFKPGRNRLTVAVEQRHRAACDRSAAEELWTRIAADQSRLVLAYDPGAPSLLNLPILFGPGQADGEPVPILSPRPFDNQDLVAWGSRLAQSLARLRGDAAQPFTAVRLSAAGETAAAGAAWRALAGSHVAVVGTAAELAPLLDGDLPGDIAAGTVLLRPLPADPAHVAVVVTGADAAAVGDALALLATSPVSWPASDRMSASGLPPTPAASEPDGMILRGGVWRLSELGFATRDLPVGYVGAEGVGLRLPADFYAGDGQQVELRLNYAYAAGLAPSSALVLRVNGAPWNMLRLDRLEGAMVENARLKLPLGAFRPGLNWIEFEPVLQPADKAGCENLAASAFSLFDDSRIALPDFARYVARRDLATLRAGLAAGSVPGADGVALVVAGADPATLGAAWTLHGRLAQAAGRVLDAPVRQGLGPQDVDMLVVGAAGALPPALRPGGVPTELAAAAAGGTASGRDTWRQRLSRAGALEGLLAATAGLFGWSPATAALLSAGDAVDQPADDAGRLIALASPLAKGRSLIVATAADATRLEQRVASLVTPRVWRQVAGDEVQWDNGGARVAVGRLQVREVLAWKRLPSDPRQLHLVLRTYLARSPAAWMGLVGIGMVALGLATWAVLRRIGTGRA
jgi:hypothetical protein